MGGSPFFFLLPCARWTLMMKYVTTTTIHTRVPHLCTYFLYHFCSFLLLFFFPLSRVCVVVLSLRLIRYGRGKKIRSACNASGQDLYANQLLRRTQYYECVPCVCVCVLHTSLLLERVQLFIYQSLSIHTATKYVDDLRRCLMMSTVCEQQL